MEEHQCQRGVLVLFCLVTIAGGPWTSHLTFASQVSSSGYEIRGRSKASHALKFDPTYKAKFYSKASLMTIYCSVSDFFHLYIVTRNRSLLIF